MAARVEMVPANKLIDAYSGVRLIDTTQTIQVNLSKEELERYGRAMMKINTRQNLNRRDLAVFDKIDQLTFKHHGMCLKDSLVTKARLKACKKYNFEFIDRDNLVDHMNQMLPSEGMRSKKTEYDEEIGNFFIQRLGYEGVYKLREVVEKLTRDEDLNLENLIFLSEMETLASEELDWTIINQELKALIERSCKKLGIYFKNLQQEFNC
jgi:hypothetical protein